MTEKVQDQETINDAMKAVLKTPYLFHKFKSAVKRREKSSTGRKLNNNLMKSEQVTPPHKAERLLSARVGKKETTLTARVVVKKDTNLNAALTPREHASPPRLSAREPRQTVDLFGADRLTSVNNSSEGFDNTTALDQ